MQRYWERVAILDALGAGPPSTHWAFMEMVSCGKAARDLVVAEEGRGESDRSDEEEMVFAACRELVEVVNLLTPEKFMLDHEPYPADRVKSWAWRPPRRKGTGNFRGGV